MSLIDKTPGGFVSAATTVLDSVVLVVVAVAALRGPASPAFA